MSLCREQYESDAARTAAVLIDGSIGSGRSIGPRGANSPELTSGMAAVRLPHMDEFDATTAGAHALRMRLRRRGIEVPVHAWKGALWVRVSGALHTTPGAFDALASAIWVLQGSPAGARPLASTAAQGDAGASNGATVYEQASQNAERINMQPVDAVPDDDAQRSLGGVSMRSLTSEQAAGDQPALSAPIADGAAAPAETEPVPTASAELTVDATPLAEAEPQPAASLDITAEASPPVDASPEPAASADITADASPPVDAELQRAVSAEMAQDALTPPDADVQPTEGDLAAGGSVAEGARSHGDAGEDAPGGLTVQGVNDGVTLQLQPQQPAEQPEEQPPSAPLSTAAKKRNRKKKKKAAAADAAAAENGTTSTAAAAERAPSQHSDAHVVENGAEGRSNGAVAADSGAGPVHVRISPNDGTGAVKVELSGTAGNPSEAAGRPVRVHMTPNDEVETVQLRLGA